MVLRGRIGHAAVKCPYGKRIEPDSQNDTLWNFRPPELLDDPGS